MKETTVFTKPMVGLDELPSRVNLGIKLTEVDDEVVKIEQLVSGKWVTVEDQEDPSAHNKRVTIYTKPRVVPDELPLKTNEGVRVTTEDGEITQLEKWVNEEWIEVETRKVIISGPFGDNITYTLYDDGTLKFKGSGKMRSLASNKAPWMSYRFQIKQCIVDKNITSISGYLCWGCENMTAVKFLGDNITSIGEAAFCYCKALENINIPTKVKSIGSGAFTDCHDLSSIIIPNGVTTIEDYTFKSCYDLTSVTIPDSVINLKFRLFYGCSKLTSLIYTGTMSQWQNITKTLNWNEGLSATVVHCSDGDINI